jgi:hypothetical protein
MPGDWRMEECTICPRKRWPTQRPMNPKSRLHAHSLQKHQPDIHDGGGADAYEGD